MTAAAALHEDGDFCLPSCFLSEEITSLKSVGVWSSEKDARVMDNRFLNEFGVLRSEEDESFASLTQRLALSDSGKVSPLDLYKSPEDLKVSGGSPQSTLGGIGSWSGRSSNGSNHNSPPATPFESQEDTLGLIYAAAGQVARLERNAEDPLQASLNGQWRAVAKPNPLQNQKAGHYADLQMKQKYLAAVRQADEAALFWENHLQNLKRSETNCSGSRYGASSEILNQSAWPPLQQARVPVKPNFRAVPLQRKESAGTGVFIPRRYDAAASVPPRKRPVAPCALVPAKVVQALNTSIETMSACSRSHCSPTSSGGSISQQSFDALMARRRALLDQQQRSMARSEDIGSRSLEACLPQEWSY